VAVNFANRQINWQIGGRVGTGGSAGSGVDECGTRATRFRGRVGRRKVGICVLLRSHFHPCSALRSDPDSGRWTVSRRWGGSSHLDLRLQPTAGSAVAASSFSIRAQRCAPWDSGSGTRRRTVGDQYE
jgi:hypothetical protein